jgi:hypothetical protein
MSRNALAFGVAALVVAAGALGYVIGHRTPASVFTVEPGLVYATPTGGTAYLGANQPLNRQPRGFAYAYPANPVPWVDANGTTHEGSARPSCVPYYHAVRVKSMEAVIFPIAGGGRQGTVLWVHC